MHNDTIYSPPLADDNIGTASRHCEPWGETRHILLQGANLCFATAFLVPVKQRAVLFVTRLLLAVGFILLSIWTALRSCSGPDVLVWNATLLVANCGQAIYLAYRYLPPRIAPELQELYLKVFSPLKVSKVHFRQLIRNADVEHLDPNEHYAMEGITATDERLAVLLSGKMKVTCEDVVLHCLQPTEFVDSPEWESCTTNTDKRFQVTLTATEPCQLLCWRRKELLTILANNQFLDVVLYNLIGKDITHKLYSLNEHHRTVGNQDKLSIAESLEFWRNPLPRSHSVDIVHTGQKGHVRSLFWKKQEKATTQFCGNNLGVSRVCNYSDPGPLRNKKDAKHREENLHETPV